MKGITDLVSEEKPTSVKSFVQFGKSVSIPYEHSSYKKKLSSCAFVSVSVTTKSLKLIRTRLTEKIRFEQFYLLMPPVTSS